jgi:hypothetical protein
MTPHKFARYVLVEALHQPERISAIEQAILQLADRVDQGRCDLVTATQALLVAAGGMSQSDAQMLVAKYFQPE